jgi:hypothetical protein
MAVVHFIYSEQKNNLHGHTHFFEMEGETPSLCIKNMHMTLFIRLFS